MCAKLVLFFSIIVLSSDVVLCTGKIPVRSKETVEDQENDVQSQDTSELMVVRQNDVDAETPISDTDSAVVVQDTVVITEDVPNTQEAPKTAVVEVPSASVVIVTSSPTSEQAITVSSNAQVNTVPEPQTFIQKMNERFNEVGHYIKDRAYEIYYKTRLLGLKVWYKIHQMFSTQSKKSL